MWWWCLALAWAGPRADARRALEAEAYAEAAGQYRLELMQHPGRRWALRGLAAAAEAEAHGHLSRAALWVHDGLVTEGLAEAERALVLLRRAASEGASVDLGAAEAQAEGLRVAAVETLESLAEADRSAGRHDVAVGRLRSARALSPEAGGALPDALRGWAKWLQGQGDLAGAARRMEEVVSLTGAAADRQSAGALHAARGAVLRAEGDCRQASAAYQAATQHEPSHAGALAEAEACARVDIVVRVWSPGHVGEAAELARRLEEVLEARGSRYLRLTTLDEARPRTVPGPEGPVEHPPLEVLLELRELDVAQGDADVSKALHGTRSGLVQERKQFELPVAARGSAWLTLREGDTIVLRRELATDAETLARWDGRVVAGYVGRFKHTQKGRRPRSKAPAVAEATEASLAAVVRAMATEAAMEALARAEP